MASPPWTRGRRVIGPPPTLAALLLAAASSFWPYQAKHRADALDEQIARTLGQVAAARERIGTLRAEWTLLEEPRRLDVLAKQHLRLRPSAASRFVAIPDLGSLLPPRPGPGRAEAELRQREAEQARPAITQAQRDAARQRTPAVWGGRDEAAHQAARRAEQERARQHQGPSSGRYSTNCGK